MVVHRDQFPGTSEGSGSSSSESDRRNPPKLVPHGLQVGHLPQEAILSLCDELKLPVASDMLDLCRSRPGIGVTELAALLEGAHQANPCDIELHSEVLRQDKAWSSGKKLRFGIEGGIPPFQFDISAAHASNHFSCDLRFPSGVRQADDIEKEWSLLEQVLKDAGKTDALQELRKVRANHLHLGSLNQIPLGAGVAVPIITELPPVELIQLTPALITKVDFAPTCLTLTGLHNREIQSLIRKLGISGEWLTVLADIREGLSNGEYDTTSLGYLRDNSAFTFQFVQWVTAEEVQSGEIDDLDVHANIRIGSFITPSGKIDLGFEVSPETAEFSCTIRWVVDEESPDLAEQLNKIEPTINEFITDVCDIYGRAVPPSFEKLRGFRDNYFVLNDRISEEIVSDSLNRVIISVARTLYSLG